MRLFLQGRRFAAFCRGTILACLIWSGNSQAQPDPASVVETLCAKRVVALGELPSHGEASAFRFKAEVVRRLVDQCGFDAVLFEAPIYDFLGFEHALEEGAAGQRQLDNAIGRFWWVQELDDWRRWLMASSMQRRLLVGGLDDQVSATSVYAMTVLPALVGRRLPGDEGMACKNAVERNLLWSYDDSVPYDAAEQRLLDDCARHARDSVVRSLSENEPHMLGNLATYHHRTAGGASVVPRDDVMYRNVLWYMERLPGDARIVIWTANVHAARKSVPERASSMGALLAERFGGDFAAIGGTALDGWSRMAGGPVRRLAPVPSIALEREASAAAGPVDYLDGTRLNAMGRVASRLFGEFRVENWGDYFDGVFIVRDEKGPTPGWE